MFDAITNDFYIVDTETGEERGSVVIVPYHEYQKAEEKEGDDPSDLITEFK